MLWDIEIQISVGFIEEHNLATFFGRTRRVSQLQSCDEIRAKGVIWKYCAETQMEEELIQASELISAEAPQKYDH